MWAQYQAGVIQTGPHVACALLEVLSMRQKAAGHKDALNMA